MTRHNGNYHDFWGTYLPLPVHSQLPKGSVQKGAKNFYCLCQTVYLTIKVAYINCNVGQPWNFRKIWVHGMFFMIFYKQNSYFSSLRSFFKLISSLRNNIDRITKKSRVGQRQVNMDYPPTKMFGSSMIYNVF